MLRAARSLRISPAGLRGIVGHGLTATHVLDFAAAFGTFLEADGPVVVGRDPRVSSLMIREGVLGALLAVSLLPTLIGLAGPVYFFGALVSGGLLAAVGALQAREPSNATARRVLYASLLYLPAVLALLALDKV